ncbi:MAG: hypothetical protein COB25_001910 [Oceanospirillales bacterium]|uniref:hypothetical protein n=1 Tax=Marinobacter maritimus TaxID=277961 RepID=UPI00119CD818|nr:hypothetical protein [Marinobacter maritimus]MBL1271182.1 hypothetical protein [Oceanospirillales bacterium]
MEARDCKSGARVSFSLDITVDAKKIVTDVGGALPEGRVRGTTYKPFTTVPASEKQIRMANLVLAHTIRELDTARNGRFFGMSFSPEIEFRLSRDMAHLVEYLKQNKAGYGARKISVVTE